ncbi:MAG: MATE family efflux transporter [Candidatus Omnitrophica bacterium]|nr:MATE family efflux transporter [Candidatus Omnitrophota bacterium]
MLAYFRRHNQDLTTGPIIPKVISLGFPLTIVAVLNSTLNLVDMFWVGRLGSASIAAVAISGTIIMVLFAILVGLSRGTTTLVSQYLGAKDFKNADSCASQSLSFGLFVVILIIFLCTPFTKKIFILLGANQEVIEAGVGYLRIMLVGGVGMVLFHFGNAILQAEANIITSMKLMVLSNLINFILDPLFIFGWGFIPALKTKGAALATVLSQLVPAFLILFLLSTRRSTVHIHISQFRIKKNFLKEMFKISIPASLQMLFRSIMGVVLVGVVASFGTFATAAYGIMLRLHMMVLMPTFSFGTAAGILVGHNLGAEKFKRARNSAWSAVSLDTLIMISVGILFFIFSNQIVKIFDKNPEVVFLGSRFLKITSPSYIFIGLGVILGQALAGAGDTFVPMLITLFSLWLFQIPLAIFLSKSTSLKVLGVAWSNTLTSFLHGILIMIWFQIGRWQRKRLPEVI